MLKKILLTAFLVCFALSANAQIATPQLDSGWHTYGGAAAGWRYGNTVAITGFSITGKVESDGTEVGDVNSGLPAGGPEDRESPIPFALAAFRGESLAGELYSNLQDGVKTDVELDGIANVNKFNTYTEGKKLRVNLAYVIGETLSIGLGYYKHDDTKKEDFDGLADFGGGFQSTVFESDEELTTTGTSVTASFRLAEVFFLAGGMENVNQTGSFKREGTYGASPIPVDKDYVENSWTNTMYGLGVIIGDPGETQFRAEYSQIASPESEEKDDSGQKLTSEHAKTTTTFISAEVKFGDFLIGYQTETEDVAEIGSEDEEETVLTHVGIGWVPLEGLAVSLYSMNNKKTTKKDSGDSVVHPSGWRLFIGYNF